MRRVPFLSPNVPAVSRRALLGLAAALSVLAPSVVAEPSVVGTWLTEHRDAKVRIAPCGENLCGRLVWLEDPLNEHGKPEVDDDNPDPSLRDRPLLGLQILESFPPAPNGDGVWSGGTIYDPESGKTYKARMSLDGETLNLRGYIGVPLLGRTSAWTRSDDRGTIE
ncbi:MAG: DUF2147 domain-containing protein [Acidobacteriota bacterium]